MPIYNSEKYLFSSINSVINQTYKNWELLCIDDFSTDKSKKILDVFKKNKKIKIFYRSKNTGPANCRNLGLQKAKGQYICFLDSDDYWDKKKLSTQLKFMIKYKYFFTYTDYKFFKDNNLKKTYNLRCPKKFNFYSFVRNTSICTSSMMVNKKILKKILFNKKYKFDDYLFKCQILKKYDAFNIAKYLTYYRIKSLSISSSKIENFRDVWKINNEKNKFNIFQNLISLLNITFNSIIKYQFLK